MKNHIREVATFNQPILEKSVEDPILTKKCGKTLLLQILVFSICCWRFSTRIIDEITRAKGRSFSRANFSSKDIVVCRVETQWPEFGRAGISDTEIFQFFYNLKTKLFLL